MHEKVLTDSGLALLRELGAAPSLSLGDWILAGGTGLALQLGHRVSEAFDFFRPGPLETDRLVGSLREVGSFETLQHSEHTLTVLIRGTKLSFFRAYDPFLFPGSPYRGFRIADIRDIALMKLLAITNRGSRKDFVDLYLILQGSLTLRDFLTMLPERYDPSTLNTYTVLKSLTYFEDAETEPLPRMLVPFRWEECRAFFLREAHAIVLP